MALRYWLTDLFQAEATGAGEGAGGTAADASPHAEALAEWSAERTGAEDTTIKTEATATTTEPLTKEIPVETTSTDAVSDDDAASQDGEETGLDPLLMQIAAAYDYTPEDVVGFDNAGLKRLLAREQRMRGAVAPATVAEKPVVAAVTEPAPVTTKAAPVTPATATFADYQATLEEKLSEEGLSDDAIAREVKLAKARWDREETILENARKASADVDGMRQEMLKQQAQNAYERELDSVFHEADKLALQGFEKLLGLSNQEMSDEQIAARVKLATAYQAQQHINQGKPFPRLFAWAFHAAFPDEIAKREATSYARRVINQANQVLDSGMPSKSLQQGDGERNWLNNPKIARIARKHQINAG